MGRSTCHVVDARRLAHDLLVDLPARWNHTQGVATRAQDQVDGWSSADQDLVVSAAWLHDIGYSTSLAATGMHALDGADYLTRTGWPPVVVGLVAYHTGAEVEAEERSLVPQLAELPPPPERLLRVLTFADLTTGPDGELVTPEERIAEILQRYDRDDPVHRAVSRTKSALLHIAAR